MDITTLICSLCKEHIKCGSILFCPLYSAYFVVRCVLILCPILVLNFTFSYWFVMFILYQNFALCGVSGFRYNMLDLLVKNL
jgi:hypothetical protein